LKTDYPLPCWYRLETTLGEVHRDGAHLIYEAPVAGTDTLHLTAVGTDGHATQVERTITVSAAQS
jgi:hypothetical protein